MSNRQPCPKDHEHVFTVLGYEDSGELVSRCGNCLTLKYEINGEVRYEAPVTNE